MTERRSAHTPRFTPLAVTVFVTVLLAASPSWGQNQSCNSRGYASLEDKIAGRLASCGSRSQGANYQASSIFGAFVDVLDLSPLELEFDGAEVRALDGLRLPTLGTRTVGGVSFGFGGRLHRWVRLPEFTLTLGGASFTDEPWMALDGQNYGLSTRMTSLFLLRVELAAGFEVPFHYVRPYALGRIGSSLFSAGFDVRDDRLGELGQETVSDGVFEVGSEVGLSILLSDQMALNIGWRATWLGATGHGVAITLTGARSLR